MTTAPSTGTNMRSPVATSQLSLEFLIKLLPKSFDGDRYKLRLIKQVDAVFELIEASQTIPLLLYVKNKITGRARDQTDIHCNLNTWGEISELLITLYQDWKSLDQFLEELNSIRQGLHENVSQFYQRLENLNSKVLKY